MTLVAKTTAVWIYHTGYSIKIKFLLILLIIQIKFSAPTHESNVYVLSEEISFKQRKRETKRRVLPCNRSKSGIKTRNNEVDQEFRAMIDPSSSLAELESWLSSTVTGSKTMVGISAFLLTGDESNIDTIVAGNSVIEKAWDTKKKKVVKETSKKVSGDTSFMIASVSKTIVWTALSMVYDAGLFQLDDKIQTVLPFKVRNPRFKKKPITYRMLYAHTSGIKDSWGGYKYASKCPSDKPYPTDLSTVVSKGVKKKSKWYNKKPGTKYNYSNYATALAGVLVERHTGMELTKFIKTYIFDPLDMKSSHFHRPNDGTAAELYTYFKGNPPYDVAAGGYCFPDWPSGQLWTNASDLGKFSRAMLNNGRIISQSTSDDDECLYSPETGAKVFEKTSPNTGDGDSAYGWFVGNPYYTDGAGHDGSETGVSSDLYLHFISGVAIGWLANAELKDNEFKTLTQKLMTTAKSMGSIPAPPTSGSCNKTWIRSSTCTDDNSFKFKGSKNCKWVGKSMNNIKKYCNKEKGGKFIYDWCRVTCTKCE